MHSHLSHLVSILDYHITNQVGLQSKESDVATISHLTQIFDNFIS
jgi:hypothetical protein